MTSCPRLDGSLFGNLETFLCRSECAVSFKTKEQYRHDLYDFLLSGIFDMFFCMIIF